MLRFLLLALMHLITIIDECFLLHGQTIVCYPLKLWTINRQMAANALYPPCIQNAPATIDSWWCEPSSHQHRGKRKAKWAESKERPVILSLRPEDVHRRLPGCVTTLVTRSRAEMRKVLFGNSIGTKQPSPFFGVRLDLSLGLQIATAICRRPLSETSLRYQQRIVGDILLYTWKMGTSSCDAKSEISVGV